MMKSEDRKAPIFYAVAVFLFFVLCFGSGITRIYGFTLFPDEFGYWSSAAAVAGYDWSEVTSYGSYYSFGYSLFLIPILWLTHSAVWAYRIALFVNTLLLAAAFVLLQGIVGRLIPHSTPTQRVLSAGIAICYPVWLLYMNMTMTEVLLVFCFVLVCTLLLRYLERPTIGRFAAAGISAVYMYTVHMRSVPVLCACVGCMVLFGLQKQGGVRGRILVWRKGLKGRKESVHVSKGAGRPKAIAKWQWIKLFMAVVVVGAAFLLADRLKGLTQSYVYGKADRALLSVNDYSGQLTNIKGLFTWRGLSELIVSLLGKIYYLAYASFGLFFAGIWFFICQITRKSAVGTEDAEEKKETAETKDAAARKRIFSLFVLLSTVGEILVCAVYTRGYGRIDALCYGRYDEQILPILMVFGCFAIMNMKRPLIYGIVVILSGLPITAMLETIIKNHQLTNSNGGYFIAGLSYLLRYVSFEPEHYFWKAYAFAVILFAVLLAVLLIVRRQKALCWLLLVWIGIETLLGMSLNEGMVYRQNRVRYRDVRMITLLEELRGEKKKESGSDFPAVEDICPEDGIEPGRRIVCFGGTDTGSYAAVVQFWLRDETIYFYKPEEMNALWERDLVLACEGEDCTGFEGRYTEHRVYGIFHLYYNE